MTQQAQVTFCDGLFSVVPGTSSNYDFTSTTVLGKLLSTTGTSDQYNQGKALGIIPSTAINKCSATNTEPITTADSNYFQSAWKLTENHRQLQLPNSEVSLYDARKAFGDGGLIYINSGSVTYKSKQDNLLIDTGDQINTYTPNVFSTQTNFQPCTPGTLPFNTAAQSPFNGQVSPCINKFETFALLPFVTQKYSTDNNGSTYMRVKQPTKFTSASEAGSYFDTLDDTKIQALLGYNPLNKLAKARQDFINSYSGSEPAQVLLNTAFYENAGASESESDQCVKFWLDSLKTNECAQVSSADIHGRDSLQFDFGFNGLAYPSGLALNLLGREYSFSTLDGEYSANPLSYKNSYLGNMHVDISFDLTKCAVAGACVSLDSKPIDGTFAIPAGASIFNKGIYNADVASSLSLDTNSGKTRVLKDNFTYATKSQYTYGYSSGTDSNILTRTIDRSHKPTFYNYYNPQNLVGLSRSGDEFPLVNLISGQLALNRNAANPSYKIQDADYNQYDINFDSRVRTAGGLSVSNLDDSTVYGLVEATEKSNKDNVSYIAFKLQNSNGLSGNKIAAVEISDFSKIGSGRLSEENKFKFIKSANQVQISRPNSAVSTMAVACTGGSLTSEVLNVSFSMSDQDLRGKIGLLSGPNDIPIHTYYTRSIDTTNSSDAGRRSDCGSFGNASLNSFSDPTNWEPPIIIHRDAQFVTGDYSATSPSSTSPLILLYTENVFDVYMNYGEVQSNGTYWYSNNENGKGGGLLPQNMGYDLTSRADARYKFNLPTEIQGYRRFAAHIDAKGNKYMIVTGSASPTKFALFTWSTAFPTASSLKVNVYDIGKLGQTPNLLEAAAMDIDPITGKVAFAFNMTYNDRTVFTKQSGSVAARDLKTTYKVPLVFVQDSRTTNNDFVVYNFDQQILDVSMNDNLAWLLNLESSKATYSPEITNIKFNTNGGVSYFANLLYPYFSKAGEVGRDAATEVVKKCTTGTYSGKYTRFFTASGGDLLSPVCDGFDASILPTVQEDSHFGPILDVCDIDNVAKCKGYLSYLSTENNVITTSNNGTVTVVTPPVVALGDFILTPTGTESCQDATKNCLQSAGKYRLALPITSNSYAQALARIEANPNLGVPARMLNAIAILEGQDKLWSQDDSLVKASMETQLGITGEFGESNATSSVAVNKTFGKANVKYPRSTCVISGDNAVGPYQVVANLWQGGTYNINSTVTNLIRGDYPDRISLSNINNDFSGKLKTGYSTNLCDFIDSLYYSAVILKDAKQTCVSNGLKDLWDLNMVYCTATVYYGRKSHDITAPIKITFDGKDYQIFSPFVPANDGTPDSSFYPVISVKAYLAYSKRS